ncbi:MAG: septal ring lytic transglycosylase RlpA family protein [Chitinophagales bacterium]
MVYEYGKASYYGHPFIGRKTASGEIFTESMFTCAHKSLPFGTKLKVTNLNNGKSIIVRVNDRGPFVKTRIVDLSIRGAKELGLLSSGVVNVSVEIVNSKFSSLGPIDQMNKILVDENFAYVHKDDVQKMQSILDYLSTKDQEILVMDSTQAPLDFSKSQTPEKSFSNETPGKIVRELTILE